MLYEGMALEFYDGGSYTDKHRTVGRLYIAPLTMFTADPLRGGWASGNVPYAATAHYRRKIKLTVEELERVKDVHCNVKLISNLLTGGKDD